MTLQQVAEKTFKDVVPEIQIIVIGKADEDNNFQADDWDYADEMLELHGNEEVVDYEYFADRSLLAAALKEVQGGKK